MTSTPLSRTFRLAALTAALALGAAAAPTAVWAAAPQLKTQAPGFYRMMLGDFEITALSDGTVDLPMDKLLKEPEADTVQALKQNFLGVPTETSVTAYLVNTGSKLVLIDAGTGSLLAPTLGKLVQNLRAAGYQPEQVDDIFITHMHVDHVGGLTADGRRVFPNATVHADQRDADFWLSAATLANAPADSKDFVQGAQVSLKPYVAAGRFQAFQGAGSPVPGITTVPTYGHTAGHTSYLVESKGQKLIVVGDLIHVGAVQLDHPSVTFALDMDDKAAAAQRQSTFSQAAKDGALVGAAHLSFPGLGHLRAQANAWQWLPVNYSTQLK